MSNLTHIFRMIDAKSATATVTDNQSLGDQGTASTTLFVQRLITGSATRLARYREYEMISQDGEISRALDTIAEEMTGADPNSDHPLNIVFQVEKKENIASYNIQTLNSALQYWCDLHDWESRLFHVARYTVMYGDCFFIRKADTKRWQFLHPKHVLAAIVDADDVTTIRGWQIRNNTNQAANTNGESSYNKSVNALGGDQDTQIVSASEIIRFTLNDDMSEYAPFGESVLRPVYKAQKQKELLEEASLIYRLQRAPEKRVFYVDTGKVPPVRQKAILEQFKNDIRQRKIPTAGGGNEQVDSVYNSQSMLEDFFIAVRDGNRGSRIETLPTNANWSSLEELEYFQMKVLRGLKIPLSYMREDEGGGMVNDGKVGIAYIQELRFALFVKRLQRNIERVLDSEFKRYLHAAGIRVDSHYFKVRLPEPENFGRWKQLELNTSLLNAMTTAAGVPSLSPRFIMTKYGQFTTEDIIENERLKREELGIDPDDNSPEAMSKIYGSMGEGGMGGMGDMGMGEDMTQPEMPMPEESPPEEE